MWHPQNTSKHRKDPINHFLTVFSRLYEGEGGLFEGPILDAKVGST